MDDMKDKSIHLSVEKLSEEIQNMKIYKDFYTDLQKLAASTSVKEDNFKETLLEAMKESGMETELRNTVFHWMRSHNNQIQVTANSYKEPLAYLRKAQMQWEKRIHKSLNSMCTEIGVSLARFRLASDKDELEEKWNELSTYDIDLTPYRPVYAPKDFLEVLLWIRSPNYRPIDAFYSGEGNWDFTQIPLKVKTLSELRQLYQQITRGEPLLGVNPNMCSASSHYLTLDAERTALGEKVLASNHAPVAQEFLKRGAPRSLRGRLWAQVMGSDIKPVHREYFAELKQAVLQYDLMIDKLIIKDVQLTASNDDQYFVFEDMLYQVLLCFSRDTEILTVFNHSSSSPIHGILKSKPATIENTVVYPPSGVIPFHGFTMYATAFCYLYDDPCALYFTFRAFYLRYWFRLHEVSSHEQGILSLCLLFERLLQRHETQLWIHFKMINVQPIRVVFKWLMRAFSGHLPPEQLLYLWDTIIAFDSLQVIPLLAVCILSFRRENLLQVDTLQNVEAVLADLSSLQVMPLLQIALMKDSHWHTD
ncbi:TBC1 domain family member 19 isoform X1 [Homalodisca vitripennis]|uniref:TBC1 domain family member 19 isoform X1 n=2 Tax=Homalodisca vitripennis TaxID=197043 RepID=UPI001EECA784|nr:TBC1 domain family member 19 isoform X1 [Homalodisca vitripennis]